MPQGTLTFAPGSSGWTLGGQRVRWMELFLRGSSAFEAFNYPSVGEKIRLET